MAAPKKIRFGILGCSRVAYKSAIPGLIASDYAELVIIGSRNAEKAKAWAQEFGCGSFGSYENVLANKEVDVVYISLPNSLHEEWAAKAAAEDKHIWCEKPAALTYISAKRMVDTCRKHHVRLMEGFMFLFHPQHIQVRKLIEEGVLGDVLKFEGCFTYPLPEKNSNRLNKNLGGGSYNDAAVYPIRASRMIFNDVPTSITCNLLIDPKTGVDVQADIHMEYPGGRSAIIHSGFDANFQSTYAVLGSKARITAERAYAVPKDMPVKILLEAAGTAQEFSVEPVDQFTLMLNDFCQEILKGGASIKRYEEDVLLQARIVEAGRKSHEERRTVLLSEIK